MKFKKLIHILIGVLPFSFLRILLFNFLGNNISYTSKLGWGIYGVSKLIIGKNCKVGSFNFFLVEEINLKNRVHIKSLNIFKGYFNLVLEDESGISKNNKFISSYVAKSNNDVILKLGSFSFIVSNNFFDLTRSITFGKNTILAGLNSQFWTHGYYHGNTGKDRIRIDGEIIIGNNVYIGSRSIFNPGVKIGDAIHIGSGSVISKSIKEKGMYVNQPLRFQ